MEPAEVRLREDINLIPFSDPRVPVYVNVDAAAVTEADAAKDALVRQVSRPVLWEESVRRMIDDGVSLFVEVGPAFISIEVFDDLVIVGRAVGRGCERGVQQDGKGDAHRSPSLLRGGLIVAWRLRSGK